MNHIYKVIWNKAKHCYTVVSEIAKNHSTSSVTKKKVSIAAILAAGMLSGFSPMVSGAADTTNSGAVVYDQNGTSLKSTNSSVEKNAIALGKGASAVDDSIAIGNGANVVEGSNGKGGVALGKNAYAGYKGTSLGNSAIGGREGTIVIGDTTNVQSLYSTVVGTNSTITSDGKAYTLDLGFLGKKSVIVQGAVSTSFGVDNTITNKEKVFSGVANSIIGSVNTVTNSNGVTIQGTGNTVSNAYKDMNIGLGDLLNFKQGDYSSIAKQDNGAIAIIGGGNTISDQLSSTVIGFGNILKGENSTGVFTAGSKNTLTNVSNSLVMGDHNTLKDRKNVISLGNQNTVTADEAVAIGNGTKVTEEGGVAIGVGSVADRAAGSEKGALGAFAPDTIPTAEKSTWAATKGAVSVGDTANNITRQITNVAAGREDTDAVNVAQLKRAKTTVSDGTNTKVTSTVAEDGHTDYKVNLNKDLTGIESMTNGSSSIRMGKGGTVTINNRVTIDQSGKISGVAAGEISSTSTDAVNGSQLHAVQQEAGKHTKVVNGSNITVEETDQDGQKTYKVGLNKDLLLGDITGKNVSISGTNGTIETTGFIATKDKIYADKGAKLADVNVTGDTISNDKSSVKLDKEGTVTINGKVNVDKAGQIHNVTAGTADEDAVNVSQLNKQAAASKTTVSDGTNTTVTSTVAEDGHTDYKVNLNKDLTGIESMTNGSSSIRMGKGGTVTINNRVTIDQSGKISGVAAGEVKEGSTDAVNGSQLKGVENKADKNAENIQKNTDAIAKNTADISKNAEAISKNTENIKNNSKAIAENAKNIQKNTEAIAKNTADISKNTEAIGKLDERVTSVEEVAKKHTTVSTDDKNVQISEDTNKDGGKDYKVSLNKDLNLSSVTTGDTKMDTNGVTVKDVSLTKDGLSIGNKTYVSDKGLNANDQKVTNVAAGDISEKSTDAVNGSQLFATNQQVAQNVQSISKLGNRINKVGAGAAALAALHPLDFDPDDKWDFAAGYGNYNGENAAAVGAYYRPNEDTMLSVGGSFGNGENMVNAGVSLKLGQGNHVSTSKVAMAKEIKDLRKEMEGLKSALLDANAGKKLDTSKLQLFPDVPKNHWAYEYVSTLKGNGMLTGYPDGEFKGDRPMTRYEFATMLYKAMLEGATLSDKILKEFAPELERFTVDTVHQDKDGKPTVERVRTVKAAK